MTHIFSLGEMDNFSEKINLDDLYEKKHKSDLAKLNIFNKLLNRIHNKIKYTSRTSKEQICWFIVPEVIIGIPKYDNAECIAYLINKLKENNFLIKYIHPNMLCISWHHWIPSYVRHEIKKKLSISVNGNGEIIKNTNIPSISNKPHIIENTTNKKPDSIYKDIKSYKPSGNIIYNKEHFFSLNNNN